MTQKDFAGIYRRLATRILAWEGDRSIPREPDDSAERIRCSALKWWTLGAKPPHCPSVRREGL